MNRAELLAKAIHALESAEYGGVTAVAGRAMAVAEAVLEAVADDLAEFADVPGIAEVRGVAKNSHVLAAIDGYQTGIREAANRVRSLMGDTE